MFANCIYDVVDHSCTVYFADTPFRDFLMMYDRVIRVWMAGYHKSPDVDEYEVLPDHATIPRTGCPVLPQGIVSDEFL